MTTGYSDGAQRQKISTCSFVVVLDMYLSCRALEMTFSGRYIALAILACVIYSSIRRQLRQLVDYPARLEYDETKELIFGWALTVIVLVLVLDIMEMAFLFDKVVLRAWAVATAVALPVIHALFRRRQFSWASNLEICSTVIIGVNEVSARVSKTCKDERRFGISLEGYFDDRSRNRMPIQLDRPVLGMLADVVPYVKHNAIKKVFISGSLVHQSRVRKLASFLQDTTASIYIIQDNNEFLLTQPRVQNFGGLPIVSVCESPILGSDRVLKRTFDIALSLSAIALLLPLMISIAVAVRATSYGPALFRQERYGLHGERISVLKFRSMLVDNDPISTATVAQAKRNDPRLTPIGAFLRSSSLDELPQLFNVLQGNMSLVGPRPHAVTHNEEYRQIIRAYMVRHIVKPGITGWAQVNGLRGETSSVDKMESRVQYDLDYVRNWSIWLDIWIIFCTFKVVLGRKNAY